MTNFDTVREALAAIADTHVHTYKQALTALAEIERTSVTAGQEPLAVHQWRRRLHNEPWRDATKEVAYQRVDEHWEARTLYTAAPPAQQPQAEAVPSDVARDAERYRWLRDVAYGYFWADHGGCYPRRGLDAAIDAAMAQGEKP